MNAEVKAKLREEVKAETKAEAEYVDAPKS